MATSASSKIVTNVDQSLNSRKSGRNSLQNPSPCSGAATANGTPASDSSVPEQSHWLENWLDTVVWRTVCQRLDPDQRTATSRSQLHRIGLPTRLACAIQYYAAKSTPAEQGNFFVQLDYCLALLRGEPLQSNEGLTADDKANAKFLLAYLEQHPPGSSNAGPSLLRERFAHLATDQKPLSDDERLSLLAEFYQWICQSALSRSFVIPLQTVASARPSTAIHPGGAGGVATSSTENHILQNLVKRSGVVVRPARPAHPNSRPLALLNTLAVEQLVSTTDNDLGEDSMASVGSRDHTTALEQSAVTSTDADLLSTLAQVATEATPLGGDQSDPSSPSPESHPVPIDPTACQPVSPRASDKALERTKLYATFRKRPSPIVSGKLPTIGSPRRPTSPASKASKSATNAPAPTKQIPSLRSEFEQRKLTRSTTKQQSKSETTGNNLPSGTTTWAASSGTKRTARQVREHFTPDSPSEPSTNPVSSSTRIEKRQPQQQQQPKASMSRSTATALRLSLDQRRRAIEVGHQRAAAAKDKAVANRHHAAFQKLLQTELLRPSQKSTADDSPSTVPVGAKEPISVNDTDSVTHAPSEVSLPADSHMRIEPGDHVQEELLPDYPVDEPPLDADPVPTKQLLSEPLDSTTPLAAYTNSAVPDQEPVASQRLSPTTTSGPSSTVVDDCQSCAPDTSSQAEPRSSVSTVNHRLSEPDDEHLLPSQTDQLASLTKHPDRIRQSTPQLITVTEAQAHARCCSCCCGASPHRTEVRNWPDRCARCEFPVGRSTSFRRRFGHEAEVVRSPPTHAHCIHHSNNLHRSHGLSAYSVSSDQLECSKLRHSSANSPWSSRRAQLVYRSCYHGAFDREPDYDVGDMLGDREECFYSDYPEDLCDYEGDVEETSAAGSTGELRLRSSRSYAPRECDHAAGGYHSTRWNHSTMRPKRSNLPGLHRHGIRPYPPSAYDVQSEVDCPTLETSRSTDYSSLPRANPIPAYLRNSNVSLTGRATWSDRPKIRDLSAGPRPSTPNRFNNGEEYSPRRSPDSNSIAGDDEPSIRRSPECSLFGETSLEPTSNPPALETNRSLVETPEQVTNPQPSVLQTEPKQFFIAFEEPDPQRMQRKCGQLEARRAAERALAAQQFQARREREREARLLSESVERERRLNELNNNKRAATPTPNKKEFDNRTATPQTADPYPVRSGSAVLSRSEANLTTTSDRSLGLRRTAQFNGGRISGRTSVDVRSSVQRLRTKSASKLTPSTAAGVTANGLRGSGDGEATQDGGEEDVASSLLKSTTGKGVVNGKSTTRLSLSSLHRLGVADAPTSGPGLSLATSSAIQPKLYVKPKAKSNRMVIVNAIGHACLAGAVNEPMKQATLKELAATEGTHFMILFRDSRCQYRAVYAFDLELEELRLICGTGPRRITHDMANRFYKYNSGGKHFTEITSTNHLSPVVDAITIHDALWNKSSGGQSAAALSLLSGRL